MTEFDIQETLTERFLQLNDFSGRNYIEFEEGLPVNVHERNKPFEVPDNGRWFDLNLLPNPPEPAGLYEDAQNVYTGLFDIDVYTPVDCGEEEAEEKYRWISRLFSRGLSLGCVDIVRCYIATRGVDNGMYRLQAAVDWSAEIDKEEKEE